MRNVILLIHRVLVVGWLAGAAWCCHEYGFATGAGFIAAAAIVMTLLYGIFGDSDYK